MIKDRRYTVPIARITEETENVRTFNFELDIPVLPGQFIMLTDFNGGEKPFSISDCAENCSKAFFSITVKKIGEFTSRLFRMKAGDIVSIRGAYGSSFFIPGETDEPGPRTPGSILNIGPSEFKPVLCGGGFGLPPLYLLCRRLLDAGTPVESIHVIAAGRTEEDLLFEQRFAGLGVSYTGAAETLDDADAAGRRENGCGRICGTAADALADLAGGGGREVESSSTGRQYNFLYASGPDLMMKSLILQLSSQTEYQFLFERYMKCAIGICGSCATDPGGIRICKEGPALWRSQVEQLKDFGVYRRTASGSVEYFQNRLAEDNVISGARP